MDAKKIATKTGNIFLIIVAANWIFGALRDAVQADTSAAIRAAHSVNFLIGYNIATVVISFLLVVGLRTVWTW